MKKKYRKSKEIRRLLTRKVEKQIREMSAEEIEAKLDELEKKVEEQRSKREERENKAKREVQEAFDDLAGAVFGRDTFLVLTKKQAKYEHLLNVYRMEIAHTITNRALSNPSSRALLSEYEGDEIVLTGIISDFEYNEKTPLKSRILLENPVLQAFINGNMIYNLPKNKYVDSHIWVSMNKMGSAKKITTLSIGDIVKLQANLKIYRGVGDYGIKSDKYGLENIMIISNGVPYEADGKIELKDNYNHHGDWVAKMYNRGVKDGQMIIDYDIKPSVHPSYQERMNGEVSYADAFEYQKAIFERLEAEGESGKG